MSEKHKNKIGETLAEQEQNKRPAMLEPNERILVGITLLLCAAIIAFNWLSLSGYLPEVTKTSAVSIAFSSKTDDARININTATMRELMTLPGIGEKRAAKIIEYRDLHGFFQSVENLVLVEDIGEAILNNCRDFITAGPPEPLP